MKTPPSDDELIVNIYDIQEPRDSLKLPFYELVKHMSELGWVVHVTMFNGRFGWVSFEKCDPWHERPKLALHCRYGYRLDDGHVDTLNKIAQRAAELCMVVYSTFAPSPSRPALLPGNADSHGLIKADRQANKSPYLEKTWADYSQRKEDCRLHIKPGSSGEVCLIDQFTRTILSLDEQVVVLKQIDALKPVLTGQYVFGG